MKDIYYGSGMVVFDETYNFWVILSRSRVGVTIQRLASKSSPRYLLYAKLRHYRPLAIQLDDKVRITSSDSNIFTVGEIYYDMESRIVRVALVNNIGTRASMGLKSLIETVELHG